MPGDELDARLRRLDETLSYLLDGNFDAIEHVDEVPADALGRIEETVDLLVMDIKTVTIANRDKEASLLLQQRELEVQRAQIERQAAAILELSAPILEIWSDVLVLPLIGTIDARRGEILMTTLLDAIAERRTRWAILDITGVELVDTHTADNLIRMIRAAGLLGVSCVLCGTRPAVARTLERIGVDFSRIAMTRNLEQALRHCLGQMR